MMLVFSGTLSRYFLNCPFSDGGLTGTVRAGNHLSGSRTPSAGSHGGGGITLDDGNTVDAMCSRQAPPGHS